MNETNNNFNLQRFLAAQEDSYNTALAEICNGRKRSHWIWYIFPQISGLGKSPMSEMYAIKSLDEAKAYLQNETLKSRLIEISEELLKHDCSINEIVCFPDDKKICSCMTLFREADGSIDVFQRVIDKFFGGKPDYRTISKVKKNNSMNAETWLKKISIIDKLNRMVKEPGWFSEDKEKIYAMKDAFLEKLLTEKPAEVNITLYYVPYLRYSEETKNRAGDLMRSDGKKHSFEYYLEQVEPTSADREDPTKAMIEIVAECMEQKFSLHIPVEKMPECYDVSTIQRKKWIPSAEYHHIQFKELEEQYNNIN